MFEDKTTSLGALHPCDQLMARAFLDGSSWEEQFEEWDDGSGMVPPKWLAEWSKGWRSEPLFSMEGDDWWMCECQLVFDEISDEAWIMVYQYLGGDDGVHFKPIATDRGSPKAEEVWGFCVKEIESLGDFSLRGTFTIDSTEWLPKDRVTASLKRTLAKYGESTVGGLPLEKWLLREYGKPMPRKSSKGVRDDDTSSGTDPRPQAGHDAGKSRRKDATTMGQNRHRPKALWSQKSLTPSVGAYFDSYRGEFSTNSIRSHYPYEGKALATFRQVMKMDKYEASQRFEGKGAGCWTMRADRELNDLTADLLAAADALGGKLEKASSSSSPGGIGVDAGTVWVAFLGGGVGVEVVLCEDEYTNRVKALQRTTIRGPRAYRALLELLGFDWINRRLTGEPATPSHQEFIQLVNDLLTKGDS